ncbi:MAG: hypothetical protein QOJ27_1109 [Sphingomonadales bacterium]|nr:hypothetical protein [Sphingomonadales bacterium]
MKRQGDMRPWVRAAALVLIAFGALPETGLPFLSAPPARAASATQRIGGTWDLTWRNRRGEIRSGSMVIEQHGTELFAEVYDRGGATATGSIAGSAFTLRGSRLALPFTVTGRVKGRKMSGVLVALGTERRFIGIRRGRR